MTTLFKPQLVLHRERNGLFTLSATTATPSACFGPGRATPGAPRGVLIVSEAQPVLLHITHRGGPCAEVVTPVHHRLRHLDIPAGKSEVIAFALVDGKSMGSAAIAIRAALERPEDQTAAVNTHGWYAWVSAVPSGTASLFVHGVSTLPTPGYRARLDATGGGGRDLLLDLVIDELPGGWPDVVVERELDYEENDYKGQYQLVRVRTPEGELELPIHQAQ